MPLKGPGKGKVNSQPPGLAKGSSLISRCASQLLCPPGQGGAAGLGKKRSHELFLEESLTCGVGAKGIP